MVRFRKRRLYSLLIFLGIAAVIFFCFQIFSLEVLTFQSQSEYKRKYGNPVSEEKQKKHDVGFPVKDMFSDNVDIAHHVEVNYDKDCSKDNCERDQKDNVHEVVDSVAQGPQAKRKGKHEGKTHKPLNKGQHVAVKPLASPNHQPGQHENIHKNPLYKKDNGLDQYVIHKANEYPVHAAPGHQGKGDKLGEDWMEVIGMDTEVIEMVGNNEAARESIPHGVYINAAHLYQPNSNDVFTCVLSKENIPYSRVNDNYCDCSDSTDEPGTSACPKSRFYCTFQTRTGKPKWVSASKVNDGICDCCDGSDEWMNREPPPHVKLTDNVAHYKLYHGPCRDHCSDLRREEEAELQARREGLQLKVQYAAAGKDHHDASHTYGEDGEFYKLSQNCYTTKADKYEYTVCPFKEVKQQWFPQPSKVIGRDGVWMSQGRQGWRLKMDGGDSNNCPDYKHRSTLIVFQCGTEDKIVWVQETEVCEYTLKFTTPAAC